MQVLSFVAFQVPQYCLDYSWRSVDASAHVRHHVADSTKNNIRTYVWPALREGSDGPTVHRAVVIT